MVMTSKNGEPCPVVHYFTLFLECRNKDCVVEQVEIGIMPDADDWLPEQRNMAARTKLPTARVQAPPHRLAVPAGCSLRRFHQRCVLDARIQHPEDKGNRRSGDRYYR
jgi:hypothetical protein